MARIIFGSVVSDISGSIAGHTIQKNSYGSTIRTKPQINRSVSANQLNTRQIMARVTQKWQLLSSDERNRFNRFLTFSPDYAWHNNKAILSGFALFCKWEYYQLLYSGNFVTTINYVPRTKPTCQPTLFLVGGRMIFTLAPFGSDINILGFLRMSQQVNDSAAISDKGLRNVAIVPIDNSTTDVTDNYVAAFGQIPPYLAMLNIGVTFVSIDNPIVFAEQLYNIPVLE